MFSAFRERMGERLKAIGPKDEADKAIAALIDKGTSEELLGPDWQSSFELVDLVNSQPQIMCEKLLRTVNRTIARPNAKVQLLALSMLDTCVRNCHPLLHTTLANSLIWSDMVKLVQDTSVSRIDDEVRDKILAMIEDYARSLGHLPTFKDTYESLVDQGVGFPVRPEAESAPFTPYQPPNLPPVSTPTPTDSPAPTPTHNLPPTHDGNAAAAAAAAMAAGGGDAAVAGAASEEGNMGLAALSSLRRGSSKVAEVFKGPAANVASSVTMEAAGSAAQKAGGGVAALGSVASTAAKVTPAGWVMDLAGNLVPEGTKEGLYAKFSGLFSKDEPPSERELQAMREREQLEKDRQQLERDKALRQRGQAQGALQSQRSSEVLNALSEEDRKAIQAVMAADRESAQLSPVGTKAREANPPPHIPDDPSEALQIISDAVGLFAEMVGGVKDEDPTTVRDPVIADLAEQCPFFQSKLMSLADSLTDESQLLSSLALNDTLSASTSRYDELLARTLTLQQGRQAQRQQQQQQQQQQAPVQLQQQQQQQHDNDNLVFGGLSGGGDEPRFTLLDEDEEEADEGEDLQTKRLGGSGPEFTFPPPQPPPQPLEQQQPLTDLLGGPSPAANPVLGNMASNVVPEGQQQQEQEQQEQEQQLQQQQQEGHGEREARQPHEGGARDASQGGGGPARPADGSSQPSTGQ